MNFAGSVPIVRTPLDRPLDWAVLGGRDAIDSADLSPLPSFRICDGVGRDPLMNFAGPGRSRPLFLLFFPRGWGGWLGRNHISRLPAVTTPPPLSISFLVSRRRDRWGSGPAYVLRGPRPPWIHSSLVVRSNLRLAILPSLPRFRAAGWPDHISQRPALPPLPPNPI